MLQKARLRKLIKQPQTGRKYLQIILLIKKLAFMIYKELSQTIMKIKTTKFQMSIIFEKILNKIQND